MRPFWRSVPLTTRLPLLLAVQAAVVVGGSLVLTYGVLTRDAQHAAQERLTRAVQEVAASAAAGREAYLDRLRGAIAPGTIALAETLAAAPDAAGAAFSSATASSAGTAAARDALQQWLSALPVVAGAEAAVWSDDGRLLAGTGPAAARFEPPPLTLVGAAGWSSPLFASNGRVLTWHLLRLARDGRSAGYLAAQMTVGGPADATRTLSELTGEDVIVHLRNAEDAFWARHPSHPVPPPRQRLLRGTQLSYQRDGVGRTIAAEAAVPGTPWLVVFETPVRAVNARARETVLLLAAVSMLLLLVGIVISWALGRRIARPLADVSGAAAALMHGDYTQRVEHDGDDEIGRLAASFNRMADEVEATRAELLRRVAEAQDARRSAETANRAKSDFLAVMSHELRTPLNAIGGYTQLLEMGAYGAVSVEQRDALVRIERNQAHLLTLINDVLSYARLEAAEVSYTLEALPAADALAGLDTLIGPQVAAAGLTLLIEPVDPPIVVLADRDKLRQILINLLINAVKFTSAGGTVTVQCAAGAGMARIAVHDTGIGIAPDRLQAVFEPFFQCDRALSRPAEGVGLGLTISRDLARGMGGDLTVVSAPGVGSTFTVHLPLATVGMTVEQPAPADSDRGTAIHDAAQVASTRSTTVHDAAPNTAQDTAQPRR
jgi:signal transduction histidine kinase